MPITFALRDLSAAQGAQKAPPQTAAQWVAQEVLPSPSFPDGMAHWKKSRESRKILLTKWLVSGKINPAVGTAGVAQLVEQLICNQQVGGSNPSTSSKLNMGEFQSGQMGQTVNLLSLTSVVRIHLPPPKSACKSGCFFCACSTRILFLARISNKNLVNKPSLSQDSCDVNYYFTSFL